MAGRRDSTYRLRHMLCAAVAAAAAASVHAQAQAPGWEAYAPAGGTGVLLWNPEAGGSPVQRVLRGTQAPGGEVLMVDPARLPPATRPAQEKHEGLTPSTALSDTEAGRLPFGAGDALPSSTLRQATAATAAAGTLDVDAAPVQASEPQPVVSVPEARKPIATEGVQLKNTQHIERSRTPPPPKKKRARKPRR